MKTSLRAIADKAKKNKEHRFQNLYQMLDGKLLWESWSELNRKAGAGVDRVDYWEYGNNIIENIQKLVERLKKKTYRAALVRRTYIPKSNGKLRPLGIPTVEDKLLQHAASRILQAIFEQDFLGSSFGYRPERGAKEATRTLKRKLVEEDINFVVEADIKGYFDNIDHEWMLTMLKQRIDDKAFLKLIDKWLKAGILDGDAVIHPEAGTPQGGIVSPVLANIYMHYTLGLWFEKVVKKHCKGKAEIIVYADDFVALFQYKIDAERFYRVLGKRFAKFGLTLSEEKTKIVNFALYANDKFEFLGFEYRRARTTKRMVRNRTIPKRISRSIDALKGWLRENAGSKVSVLMEGINAKLRGYYNYYGVKGNYASISLFYYRVTVTLFRFLNRRSQKRSYNWAGFNEMLKDIGLLKPRLTWA
jgi:group II intron reverse transcriptase/maturase